MHRPSCKNVSTDAIFIVALDQVPAAGKITLIAITAHT
jgi:hypothetical protein